MLPKMGVLPEKYSGMSLKQTLLHDAKTRFIQKIYARLSEGAHYLWVHRRARELAAQIDGDVELQCVAIPDSFERLCEAVDVALRFVRRVGGEHVPTLRRPESAVRRCLAHGFITQ